MAVSGEFVDDAADELGREPVLELLKTCEVLAAEPMETRLLVLPSEPVEGDNAWAPKREAKGFVICAILFWPYCGGDCVSLGEVR